MTDDELIAQMKAVEDNITAVLDRPHPTASHEELRLALSSTRLLVQSWKAEVPAGDELVIDRYRINLSIADILKLVKWIGSDGGTQDAFTLQIHWDADRGDKPFKVDFQSHSSFAISCEGEGQTLGEALDEAEKASGNPDVRRLQVQAMLGDYHLAHQPFWDTYYTTLELAIEAADRTWDWVLTESLEYAKDPSGVDNVCVYVYDADADDLCEHPIYVRGNPEAWKEEPRNV